MSPSDPRRLRFGGAFLAAIVIVLASACESAAPETPGVVQGIVTAEGVPLPGVTVELSGPVSRVTETGTDGRYRLEEVPSGAYVVSVRNLPPDAAFSTISRTATVTPGSAVSVDFGGSFIRSAQITGIVVANDDAIPGVAVTLSGPDVGTTQTGADGRFSFSALRAGSYEIEISGYPPRISFALTRIFVAMPPGQSHEVRFEGEHELSASVIIRSIEQVLANGTRIPADPEELVGTIDVGVTLDRAEDTVDSLVVMLGSRVVGKQLFNPPPSGAGPARVPVDLFFRVRTDDFDIETGVPVHMNGNTVLTARLASREGGESAWVSSRDVRLANRDVFHTVVTPALGPIIGSDGDFWVGGDLSVGIFPVVYAPERQIESMTVDVRRSTGSVVARRVVTGTSPFDMVFPVAPEAPGSLAGHVTEAGTTDRVVIVEARYADGQAYPGLPLIVGDPLRIDQAPPHFTSFQIPAQIGSSSCCSANWIGADFEFASVLDGAGDIGSGLAETRFHAGAPSLADAELMELPPVTRGADLPATDGNTAFRAIAVLEDRLGNRRIASFQAGPGNPLTGARGGAVFGIDHTPPTAVLAIGGGTLPVHSVNPPSGSVWGLSVTDAGSGLGPLPVMATVRRFGPTDPSSGSCLYPTGQPACEATISGLLRPVPPGAGSGYLRFRGVGVDRAGNRSTSVIEAWALVDAVPPLVPGLVIGSELVPGQDALVHVEALDDIDLRRVHLVSVFDTEGGDLRFPVMDGSRVVGTPFDGVYVQEASVAFHFPFVQGIQRALSGPDGSGAGGPVHPVRAFRGVAEDAAGNTTARTVNFTPVDPLSPLGFDADTRGEADAVTIWRITASEFDVCRSPSGEGCAPGVPSQLQFDAVAGGAGGVFPIPFARVDFILMAGGGGDPVWIGSSESAELESDETDERRYRWSFTWAPGPGVPAGTVRVGAIGTDAAGNGLLIGTPVDIVLHP